MGAASGRFQRSCVSSKVYAGVADGAAQPSGLSFSSGLAINRRASTLYRASDGMLLMEGGGGIAATEGPQSAAARGMLSTSTPPGSTKKRATLEGEAIDDSDDLPQARSVASFTSAAHRTSMRMRASEGNVLATVGENNKPSAAFFSSHMAARRSSIMRASEGAGLIVEVGGIMMS